MSELREALSRTTYPRPGMMLFAVFPSALEPVLALSSTIEQPDKVHEYEIEEFDPRIGDRVLREYALEFDELPAQLDEVAEDWLAAARAAGADFAWFAFEASFSFERIFAGSVARQVYGVATDSGIELALDDEYRQGSAWRDRLVELRATLGITGQTD